MTITKEPELSTQELERVTIRFAGDSGDGMQLTGTQFTRTAAVRVNWVPVSCMPSPESPAKRIVTRSSSWVGSSDSLVAVTPLPAPSCAGVAEVAG